MINKSFRVVLACAMCLAMSLAGRPRTLAGEIYQETLFTQIKDLMDSKSPVSSGLAGGQENIPGVTQEQAGLIKKNILEVFSKLNQGNREPERGDLGKELDLLAFFLKFSDEYAWKDVLVLLEKKNMKRLKCQ
jgi:hypothetical protein